MEATEVTFARRIAIGAIAASLVPLLFAALIFANLKEGNRKREQVLLADDALQLIMLLERLVIDMEDGVRGFRIKGEEAFLKPYNSAAAKYPAVLSRLHALLDSEEDRRILAAIQEAVEHWRTDLAEPRIAAIRASPPVAMERGILLPTLPESLDMAAGKQQMDALRALFEELASQQSARDRKLLDERSRADANLSRLLWFGAFGFSVLMLVGAIHLLRRFDRQTRVLFAGIAAAERGEYREVVLPGNDEPARIAAAFNRMVAAVGKSEEELRRRAEELQEGRERLASILESIGEGVVVADRNGKFMVFNPAAELLLGVGATATGPGEWTETYGVFLPDGVTPFPAEELPLARAIRGESVNDIEIHIRNPGVPAGASISVSGRPIRTAAGSIGGGVVVLRDVTERKRAEEALKESERVLTQQTAQLESANRELDAFSYSVSHDLRAPLRAIDGFSQVLQEEFEGRLSTDGEDALLRVRGATRRMGELIDDLLKLSRVSQGELRHERVDLSEIARDVAEGHRRQEPDRQVEVVIVPGAVVDGDPQLLRVALENLLDNAFKFTSKRADAKIEFGTRDNNGRADYFVRDNGVGFDMAYVGKLFGAFQRLHSAVEFPGTGIGLATVRRIVHRHGGSVQAEGAPGKGATISFTL